MLRVSKTGTILIQKGDFSEGNTLRTLTMKMETFIGLTNNNNDRLFICDRTYSS